MLTGCGFPEFKKYEKSSKIKELGIYWIFRQLSCIKGVWAGRNKILSYNNHGCTNKLSFLQPWPSYLEHLSLLGIFSPVGSV